MTPVARIHETRVVADDGRHNAFTDLVYWRGRFWLVYVSSPSHFRSPRSRLVLLRSGDARHWEKVREFDGAGQDIRDPKFGIIEGRLFLYALLNLRFDPEPCRTIAASSDDGREWTGFRDVLPEGWLLGRPVASGGGVYHAPAHRLDRGAAVLLRSSDGFAWTILGVIHEGKEERADETAILPLADGRMLAVTRLEAGGSVFGSPRASTLISVADFPFSSWTPTGRSRLTRLDGPCLFGVDDRVFALGRRQTRVAGPFARQGSAFGRKRTALFLVDAARGELAHVLDLPSSGDTSYAAAAIAGGTAFVSYYSSDPRRDQVWLLGMILPTRVQISSFLLSELRGGVCETTKEV